MSSTVDSEHPPAASEKPLLDHITTDSPEDSYTDSGDPTKLKNAKNIGTTTPEVEGEDNEPVTTIEDYPSTPVSTMDPLFQALPLTGESRGDSTPLPPTPEEPEFRVSEEAETTSLSPPAEAEGKQLDGAEEPNAEVKEDSDVVGGEADSKPAEGEEVVEADEKVEVLESSETKQGPSEVEAVDLETGETTQDSEPAIDEPKAEKTAYGSGEDSEVQQEHETEAEHPEVTGPAMGNTDPNTETAEHTPDTIVEAAVEKREDGEVRPKAGETDTTIGDHESKPESEAVPVPEADSVPSLEKSFGVAEGFEVAQSEATDSEARDVPELVASSEAKETEETRPEVTGTDVEPEKEKLLLEKSTEAAEEPQGEVEDELEKDPEALKEESEEERKGEVELKTTETAEAEPPAMGGLPLTEPPKEVSISSTVGEDTPNPELAKETIEDAKEESKAAEVLPLTEPSKEGDDSPSVEADARVELEPTEGSKEDEKAEAEYEVEGELESEAAEISEPVKVDPAVPDGLPLTEALGEGVPSIDVDANPQSEPSEEPKDDGREALKAEPLEDLAEAAGETGNSTSEELNAREGVGAPASMEAPLDDSSGQELKGAVAAELEVPAVPEESEGPQNAPEFSGQPAGEVKEMDPEPDIPKDKEQETQEAVQATSILDKAEPEESEDGPADAENPLVVDVGEVAPVEIREESDPSTVLKAEIGDGISADAGPEASIGESEETTKSEPATGLEPREVFTETLVEEGKLSEPVEVPILVVEKTVENQPSYGEDLGPDATEGQKEAFEMRKADAEPDEVIMTEESPTSQIVPVEEGTFEPTPDDSREAPSELIDEAKAEPATNPATNPAANEKGEDLAQDEPVVVSHDDAPPGEVEKAEAAVEYPRPDPQGSSPLGEPQSFETPSDVATERVLTPRTEEPGVMALAETNDKAEEPTSKEPGEASQAIGNPIDLAPGKKASEEFRVSTEDTVQAQDNLSEPAGAKPSEIPLPAMVDVKPTVQPEAPAESQPEDQMFSVNPLPDSKTFGNPINLRPGEPIPVCLTEASVADNVKLDEEIFKKPEDKAPVAEEAKAEGSDGGAGEKILDAGVGAGLVGLSAYTAVTHFDDKTEASKLGSEKASPVAASPTDPKIGGGSPAIDTSTKSIPSTAQEQVLPVEVSFTTPAIPKELSESPVVSKTEIEPAHPVDRSTEEIKPAGTEVLDKASLQASAIDIPDDSAVSQSVGKSGSDKGDEVILEPALQNAPSSVHGLVALEEVPKALKDTEASETPAIVVSAPPNPATGSGTAEVIQPSSSEVAFNEASANKARESENTPEGVRKRRAPGAGGEVSRPTSSGADTVSTRHHRNIMDGFWHVVLFGWLRGFGRFFGGIFSKSKSRRQRK